MTVDQWIQSIMTFITAIAAAFAAWSVIAASRGIEMQRATSEAALLVQLLQVYNRVHPRHLRTFRPAHAVDLLAIAPLLYKAAFYSHLKRMNIAKEPPESDSSAHTFEWAILSVPNPPPSHQS